MLSATEALFAVQLGMFAGGLRCMVFTDTDWAGRAQTAILTAFLMAAVRGTFAVVAGI
jgi:hypothetical protein